MKYGQTRNLFVTWKEKKTYNNRFTMSGKLGGSLLTDKIQEN